MKTFKFRLKNTNNRKLDKMAGAVNYVWNYCNDTAIQYLDKKCKWLSGFDLGYLTAGCSKELGLNSQTVQAVCQEYATRRSQCKKRKLSWRSKSRSLGWVPFNGQTFKVKADTINFNKIQYRFWKSRLLEGKVKSGSFSKDAKGNWYVNIFCDIPKIKTIIDNRKVGIDLGLKTFATLSDGIKLERENLTNKYAGKLATAQRAKKKKQVTAIHNKIKNVRKDWNHKQTTKLVNNYGKIYVGNVSSSKLIKTKMAKSVSDASWSAFKSMLAYKAITLGVEYKEVNEMFSTVTCSDCFERSGPTGVRALGVREWSCHRCGSIHDRDTNAAKNILRIGCDTLTKRNPLAF